MAKILLNDIRPDQQLSEHLKGAEVLKASTWDKPESSIDTRVFDLFELVRKHSGGKPAKFHSGFRNFIPLGGSTNSAHLRGMACDVHLDGEQLKELRLNIVSFLQEAYIQCGLKGFAVYTWGVHVDCDDSLPITKEWTIASPTNPDYDFFGEIRHWNKPLWLSVKKKVESKQVDDKIGHEDEVLRDSAKKAIPIIAISFTAAVAFFVWQAYKNRK